MSRTTAARIIVVLASLALWAGGFGLWVARQALNTDQWVETSSELLADPAVQQVLASYLADQVVEPGTTEQIEQALPERLDALAGRAGAAIGDLAERAALRALRSGRVQELWAEANRRAHTRLIELIENEDVDEVAIDLRPLLERVALRVGRDPADLPPDAGRFEVVSADKISTVRTVARLLRGGAIVALLLAVLLYAAAIYAAAPGRRNGIVLGIGIGIVVAGLGMLVARRVAGRQIVDAVTAGSAQVAAESAWEIATSLLTDIAGVVLVLGLIVILLAWLAGPSRPALWLRARVVPVVQGQPGIAYGVAVGLVLLLLALGWLPGADSLLFVLLYLLLAVGAVAALQRAHPDRVMPTHPSARDGGGEQPEPEAV